MNLQKLFDMQHTLDARIVKEHGLEGKDLLPQKILALQVELGECANEWRGFKFWSKNQKPKENCRRNCKCHNGYLMVKTGGCDENGVPYMEVTDEKCKNCDGSSWIPFNPLLEEYIDCLHFILSIGLELSKKTGLSHRDITERIKFAPEFYEDLSVTTVFNWVFDKIGDFSSYGNTNNGNYLSLFERFVVLGKKLNFTEEQIEEAYMNKNKVNHERQNTNY